MQAAGVDAALWSVWRIVPSRSSTLPAPASPRRWGGSHLAAPGHVGPIGSNSRLAAPARAPRPCQPCQAPPVAGDGGRCSRGWPAAFHPLWWTSSREAELGMHPRRSVGLAGVTWIVPISATRWPPGCCAGDGRSCAAAATGTQRLLGIEAAVAAHGVGVSAAGSARCWSASAATRSLWSGGPRCPRSSRSSKLLGDLSNRPAGGADQLHRITLELQGGPALPSHGGDHRFDPVIPTR
jgi:hypothetical protein